MPFLQGREEFLEVFSIVFQVLLLRVIFPLPFVTVALIHYHVLCVFVLSICLSTHVKIYKPLPSLFFLQKLFKYNDKDCTELSSLKSETLHLQHGSCTDSSKVNFSMQCCQDAQPYFGMITSWSEGIIHSSCPSVP